MTTNTKMTSKQLTRLQTHQNNYKQMQNSFKLMTPKQPERDKKVCEKATLRNTRQLQELAGRK